MHQGDRPRDQKNRGGLWVQVTAPSGQVIPIRELANPNYHPERHVHLWRAEDQLSFQGSEEEGEYSICFKTDKFIHTRRAREELPLHVLMYSGSDPDITHHATVEHIDEVQSKLQRLKASLLDMGALHNFARRYIMKIRGLVESTLWWQTALGALQLAILIGSSIVQTRWLKNYLRQKKMV
eukprot:TRINITY_DN62696_c0_g1_i1.p1 TRINITY_DN62696_c0_g1~~TRINITY_DN62696_c0_g1_i1.p1  ORF type:complete len:181 (+),score=3.61 TRINITY_DN62696_c0_g1_i1:320-862(+)